MIDIHNHILFGVDDGAKGLEESVELLKIARRQRVMDLILTPHYRAGMFSYDKELIERNFNTLREVADELYMEIYLGCEYHVDSEIKDNLKTGRVHSLGDSEYVLAEYSYSTQTDRIKNSCNELILGGYTPVIAHIERYECVQKNPLVVQEIRDMGALIQINADSVLGIEGKSQMKTSKVLLDNHLADIVASDAHGIIDRSMHMKEAYSYISREYSRNVADNLTEYNPRKIIEAVAK